MADALGEVAAERGVTDEAAVEEAARRFRAYSRIDDVLERRESTRMPDDPRNRTAADVGDALAREDMMVRQFVQVVGRPPTPGERQGPPRGECVACRRLAGAVCDDHMRRPGVDPLPYPPKSQWFTGRYVAHAPPYNLLRSVAE